MTPEDLARLHARAMTIPAPWTARDFELFLAQKCTFLVISSTGKYPEGARGGSAPLFMATPKAAQNLPGFALGRAVLDEAELLTLAVDPALHRIGIGRACLAAFEDEAAARDATVLHLEVAVTNNPAVALYRSAGWQETGRRKAYYKGPDARIDALLMTKRLSAD